MHRDVKPANLLMDGECPLLLGESVAAVTLQPRKLYPCVQCTPSVVQNGLGTKTQRKFEYLEEK